MTKFLAAEYQEPASTWSSPLLFSSSSSSRLRDRFPVCTARFVFLFLRVCSFPPETHGLLGYDATPVFSPVFLIFEGDPRGDWSTLLGDAFGLAGDAFGLAGDACGLARDAFGLARDAFGLAGDACGLASDVFGLAGDAFADFLLETFWCVNRTYSAMVFSGKSHSILLWFKRLVDCVRKQECEE